MALTSGTRARLHFGGDYNPEQWPERAWGEDVALMRDAGVTMVTVSVFSWSLLEPEPSRFNFGWLDRVLDLLWSAGITADLATGTASPPVWLVRAHPKMRPMTADGVWLEFGSRQGYCPSSPVFREHVRRLVTAMAEHFGEHPGLALWHVSNEYGDHVSRCWCPVSTTHFRRWLRDRYGAIEGLNDAWGTMHWSQAYSDWSQIEVPRRQPGPGNPTQLLDFARFSSDELLELFNLERRVLTDICPSVPVTTNFMGMFGELDYWHWARHEDVVSDDAYPDPADPKAHVTAAMNYDLMRSLRGGQPWLLLEQAPSAVNWRAVNVPKPPGLLRLWSLQAVARGADSVMFFQWRAPRYGAELLHSAMLPHRGTASRIWQEVNALGGEVGRLSEVAGSRVRADVCVLLDWDNWWALDAVESMPSARMRWRPLVDQFYSALHRLGVTIDFAHPAQDLSRYRLVIAPNLYLIRNEDAAQLTTFVLAGGTLVVGPFSGVVDENHHAHLGGYPGPLRDLLGIVVDEFWPLPDGASTRVEFHAFDAGHLSRACAWTEWLDVLDASVVARYTSGSLAGRAAITRRAAGRGNAWYVSAVLDDDGMDRLFVDVFSELRCLVNEMPTVEAVRRDGPVASYLFLLNHGDRPAKIRLAHPGTELLTGSPIADSIELAALGVAVIRQSNIPGRTGVGTQQ